MKGKKQKLYADKIAYSCFGEYTEGHATCETQCPHKMMCEILQEAAQQRDKLFIAAKASLAYIDDEDPVTMKWSTRKIVEEAINGVTE